MTHRFLNAILSALLALLSLITQAQNKTHNKLDTLFPAAQKGYKKITVYVPKANKEQHLKVELLAGITKQVDCNTHTLIGNIQQQTLTGYGYNYYTVESDGSLASTKMLCLNNTTTKKFIPLTPYFTNYNSALPLVVYLPETMELKYRIWKASEVMYNTKK
jgi:ecotin